MKSPALSWLLLCALSACSRSEPQLSVAAPAPASRPAQEQDSRPPPAPKPTPAARPSGQPSDRPAAGGQPVAPVEQLPDRVLLSDRLSRPAAERIVAIGDLHGDLGATRRALRLAGATDEADHWIGGKLVLVQTGDLIDRGDDDRAVLELLERLQSEAKQAGGELIILNGNHELMNVAQDFRYVTPMSLAAFEREGGRSQAFRPGGPFARLLAPHPLLIKVGPTVFVHGGVLAKHVSYGLDRMNDEVRSWLLGERPMAPEIVLVADGLVWTRLYSLSSPPEDCDQLRRVLAALGAARMVVGHTVHTSGINAGCGGLVWRIDVGMSAYYGGPTEVLELQGEALRVLRGSSAVTPAAQRSVR